MSSEKKSFQDTMIDIGVWLSDNKYLGTIRDAFVAIMPFTIMGSLAVMWTSVLVNDKTGLGALFPPIMSLSFLNPIFSAINFATLGCISVWVAFILAKKLTERYGDLDANILGVLGVAGFFSVSNTAKALFDEAGEAVSVSGVYNTTLNSTGLFTAMIISILTVELFRMFHEVDAFKIKLPDQVPPQIAVSFEYLIPAMLAMVVLGAISLAVRTLTGGLYIADLVATFVQQPLLGLGSSLPGILVFSAVGTILWAFGLHGDNMIAGVFNPIRTACDVENMEAIAAGGVATNILNTGFDRAFMKAGGTGMIIALTLAVLIVAKRDDNRSISKLSFVPNLFNIGEIQMFGLPVVLNPTLFIPFVLAPIATGTIAYVLTAVGFCPVLGFTVPWTMPPLLIAFVASGGSIRAVITQVICIVVATLIYIPFVRMHEQAQFAKEAEAEAE